MPRESNAELKARAAKIVAALKKAYPDARCALDHANPRGLPGWLTVAAGQGKRPAERILASLSAEDAAYLQPVAWKAVKQPSAVTSESKSPPDVGARAQ